jgi:hypothetical protein
MIHLSHHHHGFYRKWSVSFPWRGRVNVDLYPMFRFPFVRVCFPDRLSGLVVRVPGYRSTGPGSIPGATNFLRTSGSGTGTTQPREYNWGATFFYITYIYSVRTSQEAHYISVLYPGTLATRPQRRSTVRNYDAKSKYYVLFQDGRRATETFQLIKQNSGGNSLSARCSFKNINDFKMGVRIFRIVQEARQIQALEMQTRMQMTIKLWHQTIHRLSKWWRIN